MEVVGALGVLPCVMAWGRAMSVCRGDVECPAPMSPVESGSLRARDVERERTLLAKYMVPIIKECLCVSFRFTFGRALHYFSSGP